MPAATGSYDVAIIGAGPAGSSTAIGLRRAGFSVLLIDKARFPRDKTCGDGLTTGALHRLEALGLSLQEVASFSPIDELALRSSSGRFATLPLTSGPGLFAAVASRADLDHALLELARSKGADVLEGSAFSELVDAQDALRVRLVHGEELTARYVVGADGAWSALRKHVATTATRPVGRLARHDWYGFRTYVRPATPQASPTMWIWFEEDLLPGYAWSFPLKDGRVNLGLYLARDQFAGGGDLQRAWQSVLDGAFVASLFGAPPQMAKPAQAWPIPTELSETSLVALGGRVLFVGDAGGSADPFSGEGIAQALHGGIALSTALAAAFDSPTAVAANYVSAMRNSLMKDQLLARASSAAFGSARFERAVVRACASSTRLSRQIGRWLFEGYPRSAILSPGSLRLEDLRRPGAFV